MVRELQMEEGAPSWSEGRNEVCMEISGDLSRDRRENLCREDDAERDGQKETGVEKEGKGWMETEIESDSQTKGRRTWDFIVRLWLLMMDSRRKWELMTCEGAIIVFLCGVIAFGSSSLGNNVFLNMFFFFFLEGGGYTCGGYCLHLYIFYIPVFPKGTASVRPLRCSKLDIDWCVP